MAWTHGTSYGYNQKGCRCPECKSAQKERLYLWRHGHPRPPDGAAKHADAIDTILEVLSGP
jgi:hypothetical protein